MSIVQAVLEARKEIPTITADKTAAISGTKGSYKFSYASLEELIETVVPVLGKHGVLLTQSVESQADKPTLVSVSTELSISRQATTNDGIEYVQEDNITSGKLYFNTDGTMRDLSGKVTSAKRIQLIALLGLAVGDEAAPLNQQGWRSEARSTPTTGVNPPPPVAQDPLSLHRAAVMKGNRKDNAGSTELATLRMRLQEADKKGGGHMPVTPAEGKRMSMYDYLVSLVDEVTLSYLYGRVVTKDTPPALASEFLVEELRAGRHSKAVVDEAKQRARA